MRTHTRSKSTPRRHPQTHPLTHTPTCAHVRTHTHTHTQTRARTHARTPPPPTHTHTHCTHSHKSKCETKQKKVRERERITRAHKTIQTQNQYFLMRSSFNEGRICKPLEVTIKRYKTHGLLSTLNYVAYFFVAVVKQAVSQGNNSFLRKQLWKQKLSVINFIIVVALSKQQLWLCAARR